MPIGINLVVWGSIGAIRWCTEKAAAGKTVGGIWTIICGLVIGLFTIATYKIALLTVSWLLSLVGLTMSTEFAEVWDLEAALFLLFLATCIAYLFSSAQLRSGRVVIVYLVAATLVATLLPGSKPLSLFNVVDTGSGVSHLIFVLLSSPIPTIIGQSLLLLAAYLCGGILLRKKPSRIAINRRRLGFQISKGDIAVVVPAHNEESGIMDTISALKLAGINSDDIYIGSDGSTDDTVEIAKSAGVNVLSIINNGGKAKAIASVIKEFELPRRYKAVSIVDGDTRPHSDYYDKAVRVFDDPEISAVGPHWVPQFDEHESKYQYKNLVMAYRTRQFWLLQWLLRYGQTWSPMNVSFIIPGYAPIYRSDIILQINIVKPNLVIEDFNMTFEMHRKRLGKIGYTPEAKAATQEPPTIGAFTRQIKRWYLGFWQTVLANRIWVSGFWASLGFYIIEIIISYIIRLLWPVLFLCVLINPDFDLPDMGSVPITAFNLLVAFLFMDVLVTLVAAIATRNWVLILFAPGFMLLGWIESGIFLWALLTFLFVRSDGRWKSPQRTANIARQ